MRRLTRKQRAQKLAALAKIRRPAPISSSSDEAAPEPEPSEPATVLEQMDQEQSSVVEKGPDAEMSDHDAASVRESVSEYVSLTAEQKESQRLKELMTFNLNKIRSEAHCRKYKRKYWEKRKKTW